MKDALNAISQFPILQFFGGLTILALGVLAWVKANKDNKKTVDDGNRPATLYDLSQLRQETQAAISSRGKEIYDRINDHEHRISVIEGRRKS